MWNAFSPPIDILFLLEAFLFFSETYDETFPVFPAKFLHIALAYLLTGKA